MDKNKIIIIALIAIIAVILVGMVAMMPNTNKEDTKLAFEGNSTIADGDSIKIRLTDSDENLLVNQEVNITIIDDKNRSDYHSIVTDDNGIGTLEIHKDAGNYTIAANYGGNDQYNGCNATKKITIEEKVVEPEVTSSSSSSSYEQPHTYPSGLTDAEIEAYIQRDLDTRAQNGIDGEYNYADARDFYENCPPSGPV